MYAKMLYDEAGNAMFSLPESSTEIYKALADQKEGVYPVWSLARGLQDVLRSAIPEGIIT